jgi:anaerobic magnesium-protoporphyrin IX monomethyl ester cyclase
MEVFAVEPKSLSILLILPYGQMHVYWLPLALGYLKSNIPDHHRVTILDCSLENIPADSPEFKQRFDDVKPDIVGVSSAYQTIIEGVAILQVVKNFNPKVITVFGGSHPTISPDELMVHDFIDYIFCGEAERSFPAFLETLEGVGDLTGVAGLVYRLEGELVKNPLDMVSDLDQICIPDYHAINLPRYLEEGYSYGGFFGRTAPIWVTRGCPYKCRFCSAPSINGKTVRCHSIPYLIDWVDHLYYEFNIRDFCLVDDMFTYDIEYAKTFCRAFIDLNEKNHYPEKIHFSTPNGIRMERVDQELLILMKQAGWTSLTVAPESGSTKVLKRMKKGLKPEIVPNAVEMVKKAGLDVRGFFMIGYPGENAEDLQLTVDLMRRCRLDFINIGRFIPLPGTPVFDELVEAGEIEADFIPPESLKLWLPFQKETEALMYTPKEFAGVSLFWMMLRENFLLILRNPYCLVYFVKYYGIINVIKKLFYWNKK